MSWDKLSEAEKRQFARLCLDRRHAFTMWRYQGIILPEKDILIVGDRPGPKAPQTDDFHHTPFYGKVFSGGWLNEQLLSAGIDERRLFWINSATWDNKAEDAKILQARTWLEIIALGNNAAAFLKKNGAQFIKFDHPQAHKRFKAKVPYPFIDHLKTIIRA